MDNSKKTILPYPVIAGLYKNVLLSGEQKMTKEPSATSHVPELAKTLVIVKTNGNDIPESQMSFLASVMSACKLNRDEYKALPEKNNNPLDYLDLKAKFEAPIILLFGIEPSGIKLPIHFPMFQIQSFQGCQYLWAPSLDSIEQDKPLKMQLWQSLKKMFP